MFTAHCTQNKIGSGSFKASGPLTSAQEEAASFWNGNEKQSYSNHLLLHVKET